MPIIRNQQVQDERGAAGETALQGRRINFSNLYSLNRDSAKSAMDKAADPIAKGVNQAQEATDRAIAETGQQNTKEGAGEKNAAFRNSVKGIQEAAGKASQFSNVNELTKAGATGRNASIMDFYSGTGTQEGMTGLAKTALEGIGQKFDKQDEVMSGVYNKVENEEGLRNYLSEQEKLLSEKNRQDYEANAGKQEIIGYEQYVDPETGETHGQPVYRQNAIEELKKTGELSEEQYSAAVSNPEYRKAVQDWFDKRKQAEIELTRKVSPWSRMNIPSYMNDLRASFSKQNPMPNPSDFKLNVDGSGYRKTTSSRKFNDTFRASLGNTTPVTGKTGAA